MPVSPARAAICADSTSSALISPPSSSSCCSSADSTALSFAAACPVCELCASLAITAKRFPCVPASSRTAFIAKGKVWIVQTTIFLSPDNAAASSPLLLLLSPLITATTPTVRSKPKIASCNCVSITVRSDTTSTASNTLLLFASCRSARKCADHAIELVLPDPAECWIRYLPPARSRQTCDVALTAFSIRDLQIGGMVANQIIGA
jgi:hypothetical protein